MLRFWKKHEDEGKEHKKHFTIKSGMELLKDAETGLNSEWFKTQKYSVLKELEGVDKTKGIVDDRGRDTVIASILDLLERSYESLTNEGDQEGLKAVADGFLTAYVKMGKPVILDRYMEISEKIGMTKDEITEKLVSAGNTCNHIDLAVNLYSRAGSKDKLIEIGDKSLSIYLGSKEMDIDTKSKLFNYVVNAYKSADNVDKLIEAGDKALKIEMEGRQFLRDKDWVLDAQKAYESANDKTKLAQIGDQYVNLYLKEGMDIWLDKAITVYKESDIDFVGKFKSLADKIEEKGHIEIADTFRRKIEVYTKNG
jgi:hypothetical protein